MVEIRDFSLFYEEDSHRLLALDSLTLTLQGGEIVALVGESGSGKSTLAKSLMGALPKNATPQGDITLGGKPWLTLSASEKEPYLGREIASLPQGGAENLNPILSFRTLLNELIPSENQATKIAELLAFVGLEERHLSLSAGEMSGGEAQRALLALALAKEPRFLILDEPTSALDNAHRDFMATSWQKLKEKGVGILLITHDLELAHRHSDRTLVLYMGRLLEELPSSKLFSAPFHPYTIALSRTFPTENRTKDITKIKGEAPYRLLHQHATPHAHEASPSHLHLPDQGCLFAPRCTQATPQCRDSTPPLQRAENRRWECYFEGMQPLLRLQNLTHHYGDKAVLQGLNLTLYHGEIYSLIGESGSGKSTLAWIIAGLKRPCKGERWVKEDLRIGMVYQNPLLALSPRLSVIESIKEPLYIAKVPNEEAEVRALEVARAVGLRADKHLLGRYPHELSLGTLQRVCIARALIHEPELLIADEPTSALDPSVQASITKTLLELQVERGLSVLFITHQRALARKISDRIGILHGGNLIYEGSVQDAPL